MVSITVGTYTIPYPEAVGGKKWRAGIFGTHDYGEGDTEEEAIENALKVAREYLAKRYHRVLTIDVNT